MDTGCNLRSLYLYMTHHQTLLVKRSWSIFQKIDPVIVADVFYTKLFTDNPSLRPMFPADMSAQYVKLIDMINMIIARLDNPCAFLSEVGEMAKKHTGYGVKPRHYMMVGAALLWTLEKGLGCDWTVDMKEAWTICYGNLSEIILRSLQEA